MDRNSRTSSSGRRKNVAKPGRIDTILGYDRHGLRLNLGLAMHQRSFTLSSSRAGSGGGGGAGGGGCGGGQPGDSSEALSQSGSLSQVSQGMDSHVYPSQSQLSLSQGTPSLGRLQMSQSDNGQQFGMSQPSPDLLASYVQPNSRGATRGRTSTGKASQGASNGKGERHDTGRREANESRMEPASVAKAGRPIPPFRDGGSDGNDFGRGSFRTKAPGGSVATEAGTGVAEAFDRLLSDKFRAQVLSELSDMRTVVDETRATVFEQAKEHAQALAVIRDLQQEQQRTRHLVNDGNETSNKALNHLQTTIPDAFATIKSSLRHAYDNMSVVGEVASRALAAAREAPATAAAAAESAATSAEQAATAGKEAAVAAKAAVVQATEDSRRGREVVQLRREAAVLQASADRLKDREREREQRNGHAPTEAAAQAQATDDRLKEERAEIERGEALVPVSSKRLKGQGREELKGKAAEVSVDRLRERACEDLLERKSIKAADDHRGERDREGRERNFAAEVAVVARASADNHRNQEQEREEIGSSGSHRRLFSGSDGESGSAVLQTSVDIRRKREREELARDGSHRTHLTESSDGAHPAGSGPVLRQRRDQSPRPYVGSDAGPPQQALAAGRGYHLGYFAETDKSQKRHHEISSSRDDQSHATDREGDFERAAPWSSKRIRRSRDRMEGWSSKQPSDAGSTGHGPRREGRYSTHEGYSPSVSCSPPHTVARGGRGEDYNEKEEEEKIPLFDLDSFNPFKEDLSGSIPVTEKQPAGHRTTDQGHGTEHHTYYTRSSRRRTAAPTKPPPSSPSSRAGRQAPQPTTSRDRQRARKSVSQSRSVQPRNVATPRGQVAPLQGQVVATREQHEVVRRTRSSSRPVSDTSPPAPEPKGSPITSWLHRRRNGAVSLPPPDSRESPSRLHRQRLDAESPPTSGNKGNPSPRREGLRAASPSSPDSRGSPSSLHRHRLVAGSPPPSGDNGTPSWLRRQGRLREAALPSPEPNGTPPSWLSRRARRATVSRRGSQRDESMDGRGHPRKERLKRGSRLASASHPDQRVERARAMHEPSMEVASGSRRGTESLSPTKSGAGLWSRGSPNRAEDGEDDDSCGGGGLSVEAYLANQGKAKKSNSNAGRMPVAAVSQPRTTKGKVTANSTDHDHPAQKHPMSVSRSESRGKAPRRKSPDPDRSRVAKAVGNAKRTVCKGRSKGRRTPTSKSDWHPGGGSSW